MLFTVFTPTYNRALLLERLFQSLSRQTVRNFEWLIIDDGSTDNTESVVSDLVSKADFPVRYMKQTNQGKHIAINTATENAHYDWILTIDSDDFLSETCLEICQTLAQETATKIYGGFTFIHAPEAMQNQFSEFGTKKWNDYNSYTWDFAGEMMYVFKRKMMKENRFPIYENERFCQESVMIVPIVQRYKILYTDHVLAFGDYLEDGLSQNLYQRLLANPRYAMLSIKTKLSVALSRDAKKELTKNYWDIAIKTHQPILKTFFNFPIMQNVYYFTYRLRQKL
jgi:glycosyltransferase involved in cell wall biosynthesis